MSQDHRPFFDTVKATCVTGSDKTSSRSPSEIGQQTRFVLSITFDLSEHERKVWFPGPCIRPSSCVSGGK